ncbi:DinB family protein [Flavobacterium litorale]|uniref:DinB family protein n=1 Tax=Flavobacterium litorale TaxID=2856519 RepID=A0ABX8V8W2_9FLAO|nr:DinB family protein [Flavobacterium litorale]QYJ68957.1 DinB family protein [Flavobacterium litorale]
MENTFTITRNSRKLLLAFLESHSVNQLNKIPKGFNNNIFWNIAHIVVTQQRIVYSLSGLPMQINEAMADRYKIGTKPEYDATADEVAELKTLLISTIDKTEEDFKNNIFVHYKEYPTSVGYTLRNAKDGMEFNNYHEGIHLGAILALRKLV